MSTFTVFPAIDLRRGRVVRLRQGDPEQETTYADDPLAVAERWLSLGATWLHVVNLDGAFGEAQSENQQALQRILSTNARVQFGGGLRNLESIGRALAMGVSRVVLGTAAVEEPALLSAALVEAGSESVAVGIDAREGIVQIRGWQAAAPLQASELAGRWAVLGGKWLLFTDISRDGMGTGVALSSTTALARATGLSVVASGGVATLDDVRAVHAAGLSGVVIGRALYENSVRLDDALRLA